MSAPRMRTLQAAAALLREIDQDTDITPYRLRAWVLDGTIPYVSAGSKRLINVDLVIDFLSSGGAEPAEPEKKISAIRRIG